MNHKNTIEETNYLLYENNYLRKLVAELKEEKKIHNVNEKVHSYQNDYVNSEAVMKENKFLKKKCSKLVRERNYYMSSGGGGHGTDYELFEKYIGLYNKDESTLFVHHFIDNENIYPYGCYSFDGNYACYSVRGSWDNWHKDYILHKRCVRDSNGIYEGYVYYIIVENIIPENNYEFKFKDTDGEWIEPIYDVESPDDVECLVKLQQTTSDVWNAVITAKVKPL
jgi:hypothetical protein